MPPDEQSSGGAETPMRRCTRLFTVAILTIAFSGIAAIAGAAGTDCAALTGLTIPDVSLTSATPVPAGPFAVPGGRGGAPPLTVPAFCRVVAVATPTADSHINFEVWIPEGDGLERQVPGRRHRRVRRIDQLRRAGGRRAPRLRDRVSTDTGHTGDDLTFGEGHPRRSSTGAYRSIHVMTEAGKLDRPQ